MGPPREFELWNKLPDSEEVESMNDVLCVLVTDLTSDDLLRCFISAEFALSNPDYTRYAT